jgi:hypothetical protein
MQYVLIAIVIVVLVSVIVKVQVHRRRTKVRRTSVEAQKVTYEAPVDVKVIVNSGAWSRKTLGGMELIVREDSFQVTLFGPALGGILGSEWYFVARETTVEVSDVPSPSVSSRNWMVITEREADKEVKLAVATKADMSLSELWNALTLVGAQAISLPPLSI